MRWPWQRTEDESDIVRTAASERDDRLSEYLDGALAGPERAALEAEVARDVDLRVALEGMRAVRAGLGGLGINRAPRSFAIQSGLVSRGVPLRRQGLPRLEFYTRVGALAAALALSLTALSPSFTTGGVAVRERLSATTASTESQASAPAAQDAAAPGNAQKQAAEAPTGARAAAPAAAPAAEGAPAAAPAAPGVAPGAAPVGTATNAGAQAAPVGAAPASAPRAPEAFGAGASAPPAQPAPAGTPATTSQAPALPPPAGAGDASKAADLEDVRLPPVELSRNEDVSTWLLTARLALASATVILGLTALFLTVRRRAAR